MLKRHLGTGLVLLAAAAAVAAWWQLAPPAQRTVERPGERPVRLLQALDGDGFARVPPQWEFAFPADHGPHDEYRTEWWYLTGTLDRGASAPLGIQFVLTRLGLVPDPPRRPSAWTTSAVYLGLLSVTDPAGDGPIAALRASRGALGLAGADTGPARVWLERWRLEQGGGAGRDALDWRLRAGAEGLALDLELRNAKAPTRGGDIGAAGGDRAPPLHFYVQPRLQASGTLRADGQARAIRGRVTLEHAWGELPLPGSPVARDRFSLYLDDGRELLCIRTHRVDAPAHAEASCVLVGAGGRATALSNRDVRLEAIEHWSSGRTRARYPVTWRLHLPSEGLTLRLSAYSANAEVTLWQPAWAGPVRVQGSSPHGAVAGHGFMQLNGYHER